MNEWLILGGWYGGSNVWKRGWAEAGGQGVFAQSRTFRGNHTAPYCSRSFIQYRRLDVRQNRHHGSDRDVCYKLVIIAMVCFTFAFFEFESGGDVVGSIVFTLLALFPIPVCILCFRID